MVLKQRIYNTILPWLSERTRKAVAAYSLARHQVVHEADFKLFERLDDLALNCVDVGAHAGQSAIAILVQAPRAQVLSFEPNPDMQRALRYLRWKFGKRFHFIPKALGASRADARLLVPRQAGFSHSPSASLEPSEFEKSYVQERFLQESGSENPVSYDEVPVEVARLDDFDLAPDVIKIDVEGTEALVLEGAQETLKRHAPMLIIEFNNYPSFFPALLALDYEFYRFDGDSGELKPLDVDHPPLNLIAMSPKTRDDIRQRLMP